ncbi:MAG: FtsX-like permease family protein [Deltaproteobacteria bacterium]|nr:FtsX-like permease family protein [Deltaproteobacteria bacterium]
MWRYVKLFRQFILRSLLREKPRTGLIILGLSLGVGVLVAVRLANTSALASFRAATEAIAGATTLEITGTTGRFDELILRDVHWLDAYGDMSPVIDGYAVTESLGQTGAPGEFLHVLGVDILRDRSLRQYQLLRVSAEEREATTREFLLLLVDPQAIVLTEKFARRFNLSLGSALPLIIGDRRLTFTVRGLLRDEGPARALDGNFALLDIAAAQTAFNRVGFLDRLDLKVRPGVNPRHAEAAIARRLPAGLAVRQPTHRYGQMETMIAAFHFNLNALASIALLVGLFLIYSTVSISVITRRDEIGMLRAVGGGQGLVLALFMGEALLLASCGAGVGLAIGQGLATLAVQATSSTVATFYFSAAITQAALPRALGTAEVLLAFGVTLPLALLAALVPAREATRIHPLEAMRGAAPLSLQARPPYRTVGFALVLFLLSYGLSWLEPLAGLPVWGYVAALALVFAGALLVPSTLWLLCRGNSQALSRITAIFAVERRLASANLTGARSRIAISVAALAVSLAMMVAISIMISSFRATVEYWIGETLQADIYVRPFTKTSATSDGEIAAAVVAAITKDPQIAAVDAFAAQTVRYQDNLITLAAGNFDVVLTHGRLVFKAPADAAARVRHAIGRDAVTVSESFALRFKKNPGDRVDVPTPLGPRPFTIAAIFYDYSNTRGVVVMDHTTYLRYFPPTQPSSLSVYLQPDADATTVRDRLSQTLGSRFRLVFSTNEALRGEALRIFDSTFTITRALEIIAILVAALGVISTLVTLILERQREFALLSILGATRAHIRRMVVIEALLIGGTSQAIGLVVGVLLSLVLIYVINVQSFGWTIQFHLPALFLLQSTVLILLATALAGLYPSTRAAGIDAVRFVREE